MSHVSAEASPSQTAASGSAAVSDKLSAGVPRLKLSSLGMTFQSLQRKDAVAAKKEAEETNKDENEQFTQEFLDLQWLSMCNRMPQKMVGLASRMKNMQPRITTFPDIEVLVDNQILLDQVNEIKGRIRVTLAKALHNGNVSISLRLAEAEEISRRKTKKEVYDELMQQKEVRAFVESLGLELV